MRVRLHKEALELSVQKDDAEDLFFLGQIYRELKAAGMTLKEEAYIDNEVSILIGMTNKTANNFETWYNCGQNLAIDWVIQWALQSETVNKNTLLSKCAELRPMSAKPASEEESQFIKWKVSEDGKRKKSDFSQGYSKGCYDSYSNILRWAEQKDDKDLAMECRNRLSGLNVQRAVDAEEKYK